MPQIKLTIVFDSQDKEQMQTTKMIGELLDKRHENQYFKLENLTDMFLGNSVIHLSGDDDAIEIGQVEPLMVYISTELDKVTAFDNEDDFVEFISRLTKKEDFIKIVERLKKGKND